MFNMGQGAGAQTGDLEQLARRFWETWRDALQRTMPGAGWHQSARPDPGLGTGGWADPTQWWAGSAHTSAAGGEAMRRFQAMAAPWLEQLQRVAGGFAGRDASPEAVVAAWRSAMGDDPLGRMFGGLHGPGLEGWDTWTQRLQPWLDVFSAQSGGRDVFSLPTFGPTREHQTRWQDLVRAFADYQGSQQAYQTLLAQASNAAFGIFERRLAARDGAPIDSPQALFDLWIDAAEEAYAEVAMSPEFRKAYAEMVGGQMRLRQAVQGEIEQACRMLDLPTRTELDGAHRKIADLERTLRRMRDRLDALESGVSPAQAASKSAPRRPAGAVQVETPADAPSAGDATDRSPGTRVAKKTTARGAASRTSAPRVARRAAKTSTSSTTRAKKNAATKAQDIAAAGFPPAPPARTATRGRKSAAPAKVQRNGRRPVEPRAAKSPARASRKLARAASRVGGLPNLGFISPLPLAPEPLKGKAGKSGKTGKGKR